MDSKLILKIALLWCIAAGLLVLPGFQHGLQVITTHAPAAAGGHAATANMGGVTASGVDSGAAIQNFGMCADFVTPAFSSTVNSENDWVDATAGSGLWGHAIYNDGSGSGTVNTQNAATGGWRQTASRSLRETISLLPAQRGQGAQSALMA